MPAWEKALKFVWILCAYHQNDFHHHCCHAESAPDRDRDRGHGRDEAPEPATRPVGDRVQTYVIKFMADEFRRESHRPRALYHVAVCALRRLLHTRGANGKPKSLREIFPSNPRISTADDACVSAWLNAAVCERTVAAAAEAVAAAVAAAAYAEPELEAEPRYCSTAFAWADPATDARARSFALLA